MSIDISNGQKARLERQITLIGEESTSKLANARIAVIGLGGVGGHVCEALARSGVGNLELYDCDTVSESNINRQIIATVSTVGRKKTDVMRERILEINPECNVRATDIFITKENADALIRASEADIIIDAIDNVSAKVALALACYEHGKYMFSSMGTGNKLNSDGYKISDISKTSVCGLARAVRRELRGVGIEHLDVLYSEETVKQSGSRLPASISYMPAIAGLKISEFIIKKIIL